MKTKWWFLLPGGLLLGLQLFPIDRSLPDTRADEEFHAVANPPNDVMGLLKHACYDCHSNHTRFPWYAAVQPIGWWIQRHVERGRSELNFSEFGRWDREDQADILRHCAKMIKKGEMPLISYVPMHPGARLSGEKKHILIDWLNQRATEFEGKASTRMTAGHDTVAQDTCDDNDANPRCCFVGMPEAISASLTLATRDEPGKQMLISGRIFRRDGKTPCPGVLVYLYHTDATGIYSRKGDETGIHRWHGRLHGWLRTDGEGHYEIHTIRPAPYPNRRGPAHIHAVVWEPGERTEPHYIPDFNFADDPLVPLRDLERARKNPGRSPVVTLRMNGQGVLEGRRDIVLK